MSIESAISFFLAILVFSITPGPGVFAIITRALVKGTRACFMLAVGMTISDIIYLIAACYGLAAIATHWSDGFMIVRVLGESIWSTSAGRCGTPPWNSNQPKVPLAKQTAL